MQTSYKIPNTYPRMSKLRKTHLIDNSNCQLVTEGCRDCSSIGSLIDRLAMI